MSRKEVESRTPSPAFCATCGEPLDGVDPDEDPTGDDGNPICGNCYRERDFFVMDVADGTLDGRLDSDDREDDDDALWG